MIVHEVIAFKGTKNTDTIKVIPDPGQSGVILGETVIVDAEGFFDFTANNVTKVEVWVEDQMISSDMTAAESVVFSGTLLQVEYGDLDLTSGIYNDTRIGVYIGSEPEPVVIAGPGLETQIELHLQQFAS